MFALAIAVAVAVVVGVAAHFVPYVGWVGAIVPAIAALAGTYFFLVRRVNASLQKSLLGVQAELQRRNAAGAIAQLEATKARYGRWVFLTASQIDGQIGAILFATDEYERAKPYLERAFLRMWDSKLMLAILLSGQVTKKKGDLASVDALLEKVSAASPKNGILWSTWAYLHWKAGEAKRAIDILARGKAVLGDSDAVLAQNLLALQNDKKMKMKGYGEVWYQFKLEQHPMLMQVQRGGNMRFARR